MTLQDADINFGVSGSGFRVQVPVAAQDSSGTTRAGFLPSQVHG